MNKHIKHSPQIHPLLVAFLITFLAIAFPVISNARDLNFRIGVLGLFKPETIQIAFNESASGAYLLVDGKKSHNFDIKRGTILTAQASEDSTFSVVSETGANVGVIRVRSMKVVTESNEPLSFTLSVPGQIERGYIGGLEVISSDDGLLVPIVIKNLEDLVSAVIASELRGEKREEVVKAQSVVIRSYIVAHKSRHKGFDFCDTTHCQLFRGQDSWNDIPQVQIDTMNTLVRSTEGEILTHNGTPLKTYYSASCSGFTSTPGIIWGVRDEAYEQVPCPNHQPGSKYFPWTKSASRADVEKLLADQFESPTRGPFLIETRDISQQGGYVRTVIISAGAQSIEMSGNDFRMLVGRNLGWNVIMSNAFEVREEGDQFIFTGKGFGHGAGLCQRGAVRMADNGADYLQILTHYFPKADISSTNDLPILGR